MTFLKQLKTITWLFLIDIAWYVLLIAIFSLTPFFFVQTFNIAGQAMTAIAQNTQSIATTNNPLTSQIDLQPFADALILRIALFIIISALIGFGAELLKTNIIYKRIFFLKTMLLQIGKILLFFACIYLTLKISYIELAYPFIPIWLLSTILVCGWGVFFWVIAHAKSFVYKKKEFMISDMWISITLVTVMLLLVYTQNLNLIVAALLIWSLAWNWYQLRIASFK